MSIDTLYMNALGKLTATKELKSLSLKLFSLKSNDARVLFVYETLESLRAFPRKLDVQKSDSVSTHYRNLGNKFYQMSDNHKAWQYYNLSLLYAPLNSESFCFALANRSAVLFSLNMYDESVKDIDTVFSEKYPDKLKDKLTIRKATCINKLNNKKCKESSKSLDIEKYLMLENSQGPRFSCANDKLEVVFSKEMGRHVIAKADINVGEVLVQEQPYFLLLLKSQFLFSCSYCLSRCPNLLPCNNCCFSLYCSKKCKDNAWGDYHGIECSLMATLIHMKFTKLELLALRTVIKARNDHSSWKTLFQTIQEAESNLDNEFRGHVNVDGEWVYDSKYYSAIHTLESNIDKRSISDIFQKSVTAAVFLYLLKDTEFLKSDCEKEREEIEKCVAGNLLFHIMTSPTNMHGISTCAATVDHNFVEEMSLASAPYAFLSLINHSCAPNVVRFTKFGTGETKVFALRSIKKGMQLFDNYGPHHAIEDQKTRQNTLKFQYKFTCLCEACVNNWPMYPFLKPARNLPEKLRRLHDSLLHYDNIGKLQNGDTATAKKLYRPLCELAGSLEPYAPCKEIADCQESLKQCLQIFQGLMSYGFNDLIEWHATPPCT